MVASPGTNGDGHIMPFVANYRFVFVTPSPHNRGYVGAFAGVAKISGDVLVALSGLQYAGSAKKTQPTWGATTGLSITLSSHFAVDLGYHYLRIDRFDVPSNLFSGVSGYTVGPGPKIKFPETDTHIVSLGLNASF